MFREGISGTGSRNCRPGLRPLAGRILALGLLAAAIGSLSGQTDQPFPFPAPPGYPPVLPGPANQTANQTEEERKIQQQMEKARNEKRQKDLIRDTNALLDLARQLNAQVGGSAGQALSPEQRKLTAEIEKLARSVEAKMKGP